MSAPQPPICDIERFARVTSGSLLRWPGSLSWTAARTAAADPRGRAKAADVFEREVRPRAMAAWAETKPKLDAAHDDIKKAATKVDPRSDLTGFVGELKRRISQKRRPDVDR